MTAPNTPTTLWVRDDGTVVEVTTDVLIDELGNFFVDENGDNLLDSVSTDGEAPNTSWDSEDILALLWADSNEPLSSEYTRVTAQGDTRVTAQGDTRTTAQGDTRIAYISISNRQPSTAWSEDEY